MSYSLSALEHVPGELTPAVWAHMDRLLKPGGELIHAIDMPFPSNFGIRGFLKATFFEILFPILPTSPKVKYFRVTPRSYLKLSFPALGVNYRSGHELSPVNMVFNPDILTESYVHGLNRIKKDGVKNFRYQREGSLLVHLRKTT